MDLSSYYTKSEVDSKIENIQLKEGPQGEPGVSGVWVGVDEPVDDDYQVWINPEGSAYKELQRPIVEHETGSAIGLNDASDMELTGLKVFGKTTQNGTPTPDAPVPLVSVGDGGNVNVIVGGKNLFDTSRCRFYRSNGEDSTVGTAAIVGNNIVLTKTTSSSFFYGLYIDVVVGQKYIISHGGGANKKGDSNSVYVYSDKPYGNRIAQANSANPTKATFTATTPTIFVGLYALSDTEAGEDVAYPNVQLELGASVTEYEFGLPLQEITVQPPNGLPGIPVSSGGNYTDENGQQWVCDEVDFEKGVYIQRIYCYTFTGQETINSFDSGKTLGRDIKLLGLPSCIVPKKASESNVSPMLCTHEAVTTQNALKNDSGGIAVAVWGNAQYLYFSGTYYGDANGLKTAMAEAYASGTPYVWMYALETPIETALSAEELAQYAALHTNYPNTTIFNDGGAGMEVKYVADTKLYIDKKFDQLAQAMLN